MKKGNLLNKLLMLLVFVFGVTALNAQVMVDTTGDGNFVDEGAIVTQAANFAKVIVESGGTLNTDNSGIGVLIIKEGGAVAASVNLSITDTILVQGTLNMNSRELYVASASIGYCLIASTAVVQNAGTFKMRQSSRLTNHLAGLTIPTLDFNSSAHFATVYVEGDEMVTVGLVRFSNNRDGCKLSASQDIKITTGIDFRQGGIINPNDNNLLLGTNFESGGIGYINHNGHPYFFDLTGGGNIIYSLAAGMQSDLPPLRISGLVTNLVFDVNDGAVLGASPALSLKLMQDTLLPGVQEQVTKIVEVGYVDVTTPDFKIKYDFNTTTDVVGDFENLESAILRENGSWDFFGSIVVDSIAGDSIGYDEASETIIYDSLPVYYVAVSGNIEGKVMARGTEVEMVRIVAVSPLKEWLLDSAVVAINLYDMSFTETDIPASALTLQGAPAGVSIDSIYYIDDLKAHLVLAFDGTDFDADSAFSILIDPSVTSSVEAINSDTITITALVEPLLSGDLNQSFSVAASGTEIIADATPEADEYQWYYSFVSGAPYEEMIAGANAKEWTPSFDSNAVFYVACKAVFDGVEYWTNEATMTVLSNNADLSSLSVTEGSLDPAFNAATTSYTVALPEGTTEAPAITYEAASDEANAVLVNATDVTSADVADRTATITVTAEDGTSEKVYTIVFDVISSIEAIEAIGIVVYPNPVTSVLSVEGAEGEVITVLDVTGTVVATSNTAQVDMSSLPAGLYIVKVNNEILQIIKK